jgi:small nuclear ribonucleoprotein G
MDKKLMIKLNGKREVVGRLRGYDPFMNIVLEQTVLTSNGEQAECQTVVIRGNSIQTIQSLEQI